MKRLGEKKTLLCNHFLEKGHLTSLCCGKRCDSEMLKYHWQLEITSNYYHKVFLFFFTQYNGLSIQGPQCAVNGSWHVTVPLKLQWDGCQQGSGSSFC